MKIPKRLNIHGHWYSIRIVKQDSMHLPGQCGSCEYPKREILLSAESDKEMMMLTLLHEIRHAFQFESGLSQVLGTQAMEMDADGFVSLVTSLFDIKFKK